MQFDEGIIYIEGADKNKYNPNQNSRRGGRMEALKESLETEKMSRI
jgi:hypothetical protein